MLRFTRGNAKLDKLERKIKGQVFTFSLLSGHTCPYAKLCHSRAIELDNGKLKVQDGPHTQFRCFSASQEAFYRNVYNSRKANTDMVKSAIVDGTLESLLVKSIPDKAKAIRVHVGGDFFVQSYFDAWLETARKFPDKVFYAYTKAIPFWIKRLGLIPDNFILTASYGGYRDDLIREYNLRSATVIDEPNERKARKIAKELGLPIDGDDSLAALPKFRNQSFALLLHGIQPKGKARPEYGYKKT